MYLAPVYFVFMLYHYIFLRGRLFGSFLYVVLDVRSFRVKWNHLFALAAIVCSVFAVSLGPFVLLVGCII